MYCNFDGKLVTIFIAEGSKIVNASMSKTCQNTIGKQPVQYEKKICYLCSIINTTLELCSRVVLIIEHK